MAACGLAVWEYAWVGGPVWDLVRMDLFRTKSIDPTPNTFFEGYGNWPLSRIGAFMNSLLICGWPISTWTPEEV